MSDPSRDLQLWLRRLETTPTPTGTTGDPKLLARAATCYGQAGWDEDSCRVFTAMGDYQRAAPYHERLGRLDLAAHCYSQAGQWPQAARCLLALSRFDEAAQAYMKADHPQEAAWLLTHEIGRDHQALSTLEDFEPQTTTAAWMLDVVRARAHAGLGDHRRAGTTLNGLAESLNDAVSAPESVLQRALIVADVMGRIDLSIRFHTIAVLSDLPNARTDWERWSLKVLGESPPI